MFRGRGEGGRLGYGTTWSGAKETAMGRTDPWAPVMCQACDKCFPAVLSFILILGGGRGGSGAVSSLWKGGVPSLEK